MYLAWGLSEQHYEAHEYPSYLLLIPADTKPLEARLQTILSEALDVPNDISKGSRVFRYLQCSFERHLYIASKPPSSWQSERYI